MSMIIKFPNRVKYRIPLSELANHRQKVLRKKAPFSTEYQDRRPEKVIYWVRENMTWSQLCQFLTEKDDGYNYRTMWSSGRCTFTYG